MDHKAYLDKTREEFRHFGEGKFELTKDNTSGIALLAFCNYEKKNCFTGCMVAELGDVLTQLELWDEVSGNWNLLDLFHIFLSFLLSHFLG